MAESKASIKAQVRSAQLKALQDFDQDLEKLERKLKQAAKKLSKL
jgi:hypothetical protein